MKSDHQIGRLLFIYTFDKYSLSSYCVSGLCQAGDRSASKEDPICPGTHSLVDDSFISW